MAFWRVGSIDVQNGFVLGETLQPMGLLPLNSSVEPSFLLVLHFQRYPNGCDDCSSAQYNSPAAGKGMA